MKEGDKVKVLADTWPSGLIGAEGCIGVIERPHQYLYAFHVKFVDAGSSGWFYGKDLLLWDSTQDQLDSDQRDCKWGHDYEQFIGFVHITNICRKCGKEEPVNMMEKK